MHHMLFAMIAKLFELFYYPIVFPFVVISNVIRLIAFGAKPCAILTFSFRHILKSYLNQIAGSILSKTSKKSKKKPLPHITVN
jgi:hypothetical protein